MGALQGGDFWSSFGTGLFSAGVTFGLDRLIKTDNIFISNDKVEQALLSGFKMEIRSLITKGRGISFLDFIEGIANDAAEILDCLDLSLLAGQKAKHIKTILNSTEEELNLTIEQQQEIIKNTIEKLETSNWGKTNKGRKVIEVLKRMLKEGRIDFNDNRNVVDSSHMNFSLKIAWFLQFDPEQLPDALAHEGTHALQFLTGENERYDIEDEVDAYHNQYLVDKDFYKYTTREKTREAILEDPDYIIRFLYSDISYRFRRLFGGRKDPRANY